MSRAEDLALVREYTSNEALVRHMLAVEAAMRAYALKFGEDVEKWGQVGLLHDDLDAPLLVQCGSQGLQPVEPARNQNQRVALGRVLPCKFLAKTTGCASDENPGVDVGSHDVRLC